LHLVDRGDLPSVNQNVDGPNGVNQNVDDQKSYSVDAMIDPN
jgi:hypothetical protein